MVAANVDTGFSYARFRSKRTWPPAVAIKLSNTVVASGMFRRGQTAETQSPGNRPSRVFFAKTGRTSSGTNIHKITIISESWASNDVGY
jgi:hypothetical protein